MLGTSIEDDTIGYIGLGEMGLPMAKTAVNAGFSVIGYNRSEGPLEELVRHGGERAESPRALAETASIVSIVVRDDSDVYDVILDEDGLIEGFTDHGVVIIHSTVHPQTIRDIEETTPCHIDVIDAPISGLSKRAETGELTLMVGGNSETIDYCLPLLKVIGNEVYRLGGVGCGAAGKLANNLVAYVNIVGAVEGVKLGKAYGIKEVDLISMFSSSSANNFYINNWEFIINEWSEAHPNGVSGLASMATEELLQVLQLADDLDVNVPAAAMASQNAPETYRGIDNI